MIANPDNAQKKKSGKTWNVPLPSNSQRQDYYTFRRLDPELTFICHCYWEGGQKIK